MASSFIIITKQDASSHEIYGAKPFGAKPNTERTGVTSELMLSMAFLWIYIYRSTLI